MAYIYDLVDNWNNAGVTFTAIKMNVTDSNSAAGSLLMDLQVGGASRFRVSKAGATTVSSLLFPGSSSGTVTIQPASAAGTYTLTLPTSAGSNGQALVTNGSGVLSFATVTSPPGGSDTQIQFNDGGAFGGDSGFTFNKTTKAVTLGGGTITGTTLSGVQITGTAGQFSCSSASLIVGHLLTISGTLGGTGTITGYTNPTTYRISETNGSTTFTLVNNTSGAALTTTTGTPTGLTYTLTTPSVNISQTWNNSNVAFAGLRYSVTSTAANSSSALFDFQYNGVSALRFIPTSAAGSDAVLIGTSSGTNPGFRIGVTATTFSQYLGFNGNGETILASSNNPVTLRNVFAGFNTQFVFHNNTNNGATVRFAVKGNNNLQLGNFDTAGSAIAVSSVASQQITLASNHGLSNGAAVQVTFTAGGAVPGGTAVNTTYYARSISAAVLELYGTYDQALNTASTTGRVNVTSAGTTAFINRAAPFQTLSVQSFTGTDIPGQPFVITGSQGTGTGAGGSIIFQVAPAGTTGSTQNALATALTINPQTINLAGAVFAGSTTVPRGDGYMFPISGSYAVGMYNPANYTVQLAMSSQFSGGAAGAYTGFQFELTTGRLSWGLVSQDIVLARDAANTLALRNAANAQAFRVYNTWTSFGTGTEIWERGKFAWESNVLRIGTEKGANGGTARALEIQTDSITRLTIANTGNVAIANTLTVQNQTIEQKAFVVSYVFGGI